MKYFLFLSAKLKKTKLKHFQINGLQAMQETSENIFLKTSPEHEMSIWK